VGVKMQRARVRARARARTSERARERERHRNRDTERGSTSGSTRVHAHRERECKGGGGESARGGDKVHETGREEKGERKYCCGGCVCMEKGAGRYTSIKYGCRVYTFFRNFFRKFSVLFGGCVLERSSSAL